MVAYNRVVGKKGVKHIAPDVLEGLIEWLAY